MSRLTDQYLRKLQTELESRGWQPDGRGDAECVDEACAAGADAVKELLESRIALSVLIRYVRHHSTCEIVKGYMLPIALKDDTGCTCGASELLRNNQESDQ